MAIHRDSPPYGPSPGPGPGPELSPEPFAAEVALAEVAREISWTLDVDVRFEPPLRGLEVVWDREVIKEAVWLLAEHLLPLTQPVNTLVLRLKHAFGWAEIELVLERHVLQADEISDLARYCHGERFAGRHLFRRKLTKNLDQARAIVEAHGGRISVTRSSDGSAVFALSLPTRILPP